MMRRTVVAVVAASVCLLAVLAGTAGAATVTPVAGGLDSPRGLAFLPNGQLVVAEAGHGGCQSFDACFGLTGQVSVVNLATGTHTPLVSGLFSQWDPEGGALGLGGLSTQGGRLLGIMGVAPQVVSNLVSQGVGCGQTDCSAVLAAGASEAGALLKFSQGGTFKSIANVGAVDYQFTADNPGGAMFGPDVDSNPYGLLALPSGTYVADAGSNVLDWVSNNGSVSILHRFPVPNPEPGNFPKDAVPTCVASVGGHLVVADLAGRVWEVSGGSATILSDQSSGPKPNHYTDCAADGAGNVYVVSIFKGFPPSPGTGSIVKVAPDGTVSTLPGTATLSFPNKIVVGPSGTLYVSVGSVCTTVAVPNLCGGLAGGIVKITP
jgi:hypothetical protein